MRKNNLAIKKKAGLEITTTHLHIRHEPESREQSHGLAGARGPTQQQWAVLRQPGVEETLVTHCVHGGNYHVRRTYLVGLYLNLGHLVDPRRPLPLQAHLKSNV